MMELKWIISAQTDVQPYLEELRQRIPLVREEQRVITQRTHSESDLLEIEQILQRRDLSQRDSVRDGVRC